VLWLMLVVVWPARNRYRFIKSKRPAAIASSTNNRRCGRSEILEMSQQSA
jgi:hypothetical protein